MRLFLPDEKIWQAQFKVNSPYFSDEAKQDGKFGKNSYSFCLPLETAQENLFIDIRSSAIDYLRRNEIKWHSGHGTNPSNHLCDSQVCCINFLFPFADKPVALAELLRPFFPDLQTMLPLEDEQYVAFEWIGATNYLGEKISRMGKRTRGANFTSADAAVLFQNSKGKKQILLIEWKYTEAYSSTWLKYAPSGTDRTSIYQHLYDAEDCPLKNSLIPSFDALFYEPFYQLLRQQFLAHEMEKAHELGAEKVTLLHIAPAHNKDFRDVTSPDLRSIDVSAISVWKKIVLDPSTFTSVCTEDLFGRFDIQRFPELREWFEYICTRYAWVTE
jgi:hypothetical protein